MPSEEPQNVPIFHRSSERYVRRGRRSKTDKHLRKNNSGKEEIDLDPVYRGGNNDVAKPNPSSELTTRRSATIAPSTELTFYPAYCHSISATWFAWVKLTAIDIHKTLQIREGYQHTLQVGYKSQSNASVVLFYLNHPIQFVQVVGVVVNLESFFDRFWLFTIDDNSGATIDVVCKKPILRPENAIASHPTTEASLNLSDNLEKDEEAKELAELNKQVADNVKIGTVLQVKGTITLFRRHKVSVAVGNIGRTAQAIDDSTTSLQQRIDTERPIRQISLVRLQVVPSTAHEIAHIDARTNFYHSVLLKPWTLSSERVKRLRRKALGEAEQVRKKSENRVRNHALTAQDELRDTLLIQKEYEEDDSRRHYEAELAKTSGLEFTRHRKRQNRNPPSGSLDKIVELDEKTALLRAAFG